MTKRLFTRPTLLTSHLKRLFLAAALIALAVPLTRSPAFGAERYFAVGAGGWLPARTSTVDNNFAPLKVDYKTGWALGGAFGVALDSGLRLENELVYRQAPAKAGNEDQWALGWLVNIWWDARNSSPFTPYFGGGFGYGRGHIASPGPIDGDGTGIAYQAGGGLDMKVSRSLSVDLGYRYFGVADLSSNNSGAEFDLAGSSVMASVRIRF